MQLFLALLALLAVVRSAIVLNGYCDPKYPTQRIAASYPLKHLTVIIRHGDRTPIGAPCWEQGPEWSCDMYHQERPAKHLGESRLHNRVYIPGRNRNPGNCSAGQLTSKGYDQQVKNGQSLRSTYKNTIVADIDASSVYIRSTDVPRTFLSAQALLYGMFPPENNSQCLSQYVPINTMDMVKETMTPNANQCPRLALIRDRLEKSAKYQTYLKEIIYPLETKLGQALNRANPVPYNIDDVFDCVQAHACHDYPLAKALTQDLYDNLVKTTDDSYMKLGFENDTNGFNYVQIGMSKFISEFLVRIQDVSQGNSKENFALFSGHDTTLFPLLLAYGINKGWPPYASMMRIELLQGPTEDIIVVYYNNEALVIPGCDTVFCPLSKFTKISQSIIEADKFCGRDKPHYVRRNRFGRFHTLPELNLD